MANLQPLPAPGLAIAPQYITSNVLKIILKGQALSKTLTATTAEGIPLFTITGETFSSSHRRTVIDTSSNTTLFQIRKDGMGTKHYYAEVAENGPRLFTVDSKSSWTHRQRTAVRFANQADMRRSEESLEYIPVGFRDDGSFTWNGQLVVVVEKRFSLLTEYHLTIAPGLDPALVVGVMVAMVDQEKTRSSKSNASVVAATC